LTLILQFGGFSKVTALMFLTCLEHAANKSLGSFMLRVI
jgi:hypothetical protein